MEDDDQTRKSPIPVPRFPIWPGNGEGIPLPDSAGTGNRGPGTGKIGVPQAARRGFPGLSAMRHWHAA